MVDRHLAKGILRSYRLDRAHGFIPRLLINVFAEKNAFCVWLVSVNSMMTFTEIAILLLVWRFVPEHSLLEHIDLMVLEGYDVKKASDEETKIAAWRRIENQEREK